MSEFQVNVKDKTHWYFSFKIFDYRLEFTCE